MVNEDTRIEAILQLATSNRATDRSRTSIRLAVEATDEFGDSSVDSCHIVCGLLREGQGVSAVILGHQFDLTSNAWDTAMKSRPRHDEGKDHSLAAELKVVMTSTWDFAVQLNHSYFGTEHLLAGVVTPGTRSSLLLKLLNQLGISSVAAKNEIRSLLGHQT